MIDPGMRFWYMMIEQKESGERPILRMHFRRKLSLLRRSLLLMMAALFAGCALTSKDVAITNFPAQLNEAVQRVLPSVVEVVSLIEYEAHEYYYALDARGNYIRDSASPFGFRLLYD